MKYVCIRMLDEDKELLGRVSKARGEDVSSFIRRSIKKELARLSFGSDFEKKVLEVTSNSKEGA